MLIEHAKFYVLIEANAANSGNPALRAIEVEKPHELAHWLSMNGITAKVVTQAELDRRVQNYNERVAAAS